MVLVGLLSGLSGLLKFKGKTDIDSPVCKLHHNLTTTILLCFSLLVTATNLIGEPVICTFGTHTLMTENFMNTYCWIHTTFTLPKHYNLSRHTTTHGLGTHQRGEEKVYHAYYQWVPFALFLQALVFYTPYWLWKTWEGGKVNAASADLSALVISKEERSEKIAILGDYLHSSLHQHNIYTIKYLVSEALNLAVTVANIHLINQFMGGKFISYGSDVFSFLQMEAADRTDPMLTLFPRMTKCSFRAYGPSGTIEKLDSLCILPHNIINEKIYLFLWLWLWILLVADILAIIWRCTVLFVPIIRLHLLKSYTKGLNKAQINALRDNLKMGDYFFLYLLHKNVSTMSFVDLVKDLCSRLLVEVEAGDSGGKASNHHHHHQQQRSPADELEMAEKMNFGHGRGFYNYGMYDRR